METCWLLFTDLNGKTVRDALKRHLAPADRLLVAVLGGFAVWHGFEPHHEDWLLANL
jgi:hypothetical protein